MKTALEIFLVTVGCYITTIHSKLSKMNDKIGFKVPFSQQVLFVKKTTLDIFYLRIYIISCVCFYFLQIYDIVCICKYNVLEVNYNDSKCHTVSIHCSG